MRGFDGKHAVLTLGMVLGIAAFVPAQAHAATQALSGDGAWLDFYAIDGATSWLDASSEAIEFTYTSSTSFQLRLADYYFPGDAVQVYANGSLLGETPTVAFDDALFAETPDSAFANAAWGSRVWTLDAGAYTFSGLPSVVPTGSAVMAISVMAVPEPDMVWLTCFGVFGVLMARRWWA